MSDVKDKFGIMEKAIDIFEPHEHCQCVLMEWFSPISY